MNETDLIKSLKKIIIHPSALDLNDDVFYDKKNKLVGSIDTYNQGIHFLDFKYPKLIIKKIIRSSISDILSKGTDPKYLLISFSGSKKNFSNTNIKLIINSIKQEQKKYSFFLIGGDTNSSNKGSFTVCVFGYSKKIIRRNNCKLNDDIYVTGNIGDASVGLNFMKNKITSSYKIKKYFIDKYFKPSLPYGFHRELFKFSNSSMDISDGLLIDLKKKLTNKKLGFIVNYDLLPKSYYFQKLSNEKKISPKHHLFNGDDYQILFSAKKKYRKIIHKYSIKWNQKVTRIGSITNSVNNYMIFNDKLIKIKDYRGYTHNFR